MKPRQSRWIFWLAAGAATLQAQTTPLKMDTMYQCPGQQSFKVFSCTGTTDAAVCDLQTFNAGQPNPRGKSTRPQAMAMLSVCHVQTAAEAHNAAGPPVSGVGIKVGDTVEVLTAGGWMTARVLAINGNSYRVHAANGGEVWKPYPAELRRMGAATAQDHANGQYRLGDRVQVLVDGRWVESKIVVEMGQEYQVELPGNRTAWTTAQNLRPTALPPPPAAPKPGTPPKAGMVSCAGKIEGRYATTGLGSFQITFRSGKANMESMTGDEELECWLKDGRIYLHKAGDPDMPIDINDDGSLQTPFGDLKKKGK
jgi:hypothetical protein